MQALLLGAALRLPLFADRLHRVPVADGQQRLAVPADLTAECYARLQIMSDFHAGLRNSLIIGLGTGVLSTLLATAGAIGILRYRVAPARRC